MIDHQCTMDHISSTPLPLAPSIPFTPPKFLPPPSPRQPPPPHPKTPPSHPLPLRRQVLGNGGLAKLAGAYEHKITSGALN